MAVVFDVSKSLYSLRDQPATSLAEDLRRTAAGQLGEYGVEGARAVADAIEQALVGATDDPIPLVGEEAEAVFYMLDVGFNRPTRRRPRSARSTGRSASCTRSGPARGSVVRRRVMPRVRSSTLMPGTDSVMAAPAENHLRVPSEASPEPWTPPDVGTASATSSRPRAERVAGGCLRRA